ncbi:transposase [Endozoicomonas sp. (ex Bugula neritina AB1)]|nr:transposase [Endozoicomonas sp. (ex Bugula neritina AB1)]
MPVVRFLNGLGLLDILSKQVDMDRGSNAIYQLSDAIMLTTIGIVAGARSLMKTCIVWQDQVLRECARWRHVPSDSHLGRLFKLFNFQKVVQLETVIHQMRGRTWKKALRSGASKVYALRRITVDLDSTVKTVFGHQEGAEKGYNPPKRGAKSVHPQLAFCAQTKEVLQGWLRSGSAHTANGAVEFMKQLLASLPAHMKIFFRADSGYFGGSLLSYLEACGHSYLVKVSMKNLVKLLIKQDWQPIAGRPDWESCEFQHRCGSWAESRRFVAVRQRKMAKPNGKQGELLGQEPEYDYFCYVTSESLSPWEVHKEYGKRATCETWIEECKNQMALGQIKTGDFMANSALMQCSILAYNAVRWMALLSSNKQLMKWEPESIRCYIVRVAGQLLTGSKQLRIATDKNHLYEQEWQAWLAVGRCI